jgi:uncharacterized membrane protein
MKKMFRNAHIGIAVSIAIVVLGFWPIRHSEGAIDALEIAAFFIGLGVCFGLCYRDERAREKQSSRSS